MYSKLTKNGPVSATAILNNIFRHHSTDNLALTGKLVMHDRVDKGLIFNSICGVYGHTTIEGEFAMVNQSNIAACYTINCPCQQAGQPDDAKPGEWNYQSVIDNSYYYALWQYQPITVVLLLANVKSGFDFRNILITGNYLDHGDGFILLENIANLQNDTEMHTFIKGKTAIIPKKEIALCYVPKP